MTTSASLNEALASHDVQVTATQTPLLQQYCEQLWDWNRRLNLTRHTDYDSFVTRDLHDSRQLVSHLQTGESVLDAGAGGGVPGLVMAILQPDLEVSLSESTRKKAAALEAMVEALDLPVDVYDERAEDVLRHHSFDTVTARAVAPLKRMLPWFQPRRKQFGRLLLIKGPAWKSERDEAREAGLLKRTDVRILADYATAGRDGHSVIMEVRFE